MLPRSWLWVCLALAAALWAVEEAEASVETEAGCGSGSVCERDTTVYLNVTITNDDGSPQRYRVTIYAAGINFYPNEAVYDLLPGESATLFSESSILKMSTYKVVQAHIEVKVSAYGSDIGDVTRNYGETFIIRQCLILEVEALTSRREVDVGEEVTLQFRVTNNGNYVDDIAFSLEGVPTDWKVQSPNNSLVSIDRQDSAILTFNVTPDSHGTATLWLVARTSLPDSNVSAEASVTLKVTRSWG